MTDEYTILGFPTEKYKTESDKIWWRWNSNTQEWELVKIFDPSDIDFWRKGTEE